MNILRLSTFLDFGGIETKMIKLSKFKDRDNEWIFCSLGKGGVSEEQIKKNGKKVICLKKSHKIPSVSTIFSLYFVLKNNRIDVIHTSGAEANFHGVLAAKMAKVPKIIVEEIGVPTHGKFARVVFNIIYKLSDYVIGESNMVVRNLKSKYSIKTDKLRVIHNFINHSLINSNFILKKRDIFTIVSVSRLELVKNIESVLRVIRKIINTGTEVRYIIVGDGAIKDDLKSLVMSLKIEKYVFFEGFKKDPLPLLLSSDLYVLTSLSEGFSNSLLEAMYAGVPSLSTKVGSAEEVIEDGVNGWLVDVNSDDALYDKLLNIISITRDERLKVGKIGKETVIKNYSSQKHIDLLMEIYHN